MKLRYFFVAAPLLAACAHRTPAPASLTSAEYGQVDASQRELHRGAYRDALDSSTRALALAPNDPKAHYERGVALAGLGKTDDAVAEFQRAESLLSDDARGKPLAVYARARVLDDAGRCLEARAAYEAYATLARQADSPSADLAVAYARACTERTPGTPELTEVNAALMRGDHARALDLASARRAQARTDQERALLDESRGTALAGLGRTREAIAALDDAERELGNAADARAARARVIYGKARTLAAASQCKEAAAAYEQFAALARAFDPESADAAMRYARECRE